MPIYLYKCNHCEVHVEKLQKVNEAAPSECPNCKHLDCLEKQVSAPGFFNLKGGGYYQTDFKGK